MKAHPRITTEAESQAPGDVQRRKEALIAKAAKYFPYGYGPKQGANFVVEDVGEVSEDEEEYGEYQADRVEEVDADSSRARSVWDWGELEGKTDLDEYYDKRIAPSLPKKKRTTEDSDD